MHFNYPKFKRVISPFFHKLSNHPTVYDALQYILLLQNKMRNISYYS